MRFKESFPFLQKPGQRAFPVVGVFFISFVLTGLLRANSPFITLDDPFSSTPAGTTSFGGPTQLLGISGSNSVGTFADSNNNAESFLVNGPIYTILKDPLSVAYRTIVAGISGSTAFGTYGDSNGVNHAFLSDGVSYTTIDDRSPSAASGTTVIAGISGSQVVGNFMDTHANSHGFLFNGTNYTTVDDTNAAPGESTVIGISGANIVGTYIDSSTSNTYGFVTSDGVNDTPIYGPEGTNGGIDSVNGVSGNIVAGNFTDTLSVNHGFYFDGTNYTQLDDTDPIAASGTTMVQGISGSTIFGSFTGTDGNTYNFTYSIPGASYSTFNGPPDGTMAMAISGIEAAGSYQDIYGNTDAFFFDGTNYHTINITTASPSTTVIAGISGSNIAGTFTDPTSGNTCGFLSTNAGGSYSTLEGPLGTNGGGDAVDGVSGSSVAGTYTDPTSGNAYGFIFLKGTGYTQIYGPQGSNAFNNGGGLSGISGLSGGVVFGTYTDTNSGNLYGFTYGTNYSTIKGPLGTNGGLDSINGLSGSSVVGTYTETNSGQGYTYGFLTPDNGKSYTIIPGPLGTNGFGITGLTGVSGTTVTGNYPDSNGLSHGFVLLGGNYTTVDFPEAQPGGTILDGISGTNFVGTYVDDFGLIHGFLIEKTSSSITFPPIPSQGFGTSCTLEATDSSGAPITYTLLSGPATISNNILTFTGLGSVTVAASQPGNIYYNAAPSVTNTIAVVQGSQSINFGAISPQSYEDPFVVTPTASSGLPVSVTVLSGPATSSGTNGTTITPTGVGVVTLAASQPGNADYLAAPVVSNSFTVLQATQSIAAFTGITNQTYSTSPLAITLPVASSDLPVTLKASGAATNSGNIVTLLGTGTVTLTASQTGNSDYLAAAPESTNFVVTRGSQTIALFPMIPSQTFGTPPFSVTAPTASSGLPVTLSILSGPATITNTTITLTGAGTVVLAADQAGNANYEAAAEITTSFPVAQAPQTITPFVTIPNQSNTVPVTITLPTASSGLPVTVNVLSGPATILGNVVTPTNGPATITLAANQPGNSNYGAAPQVTTSFSVGKKNQTISPFPGIPSQTFGTPPFSVTAPTASSGLPVTLSILSGPATITNTTITLTGAGTVVLAADQAGDGIYGPAAELTTNFSVAQAAQSIGAFASIGSQVYGTPVTITPPVASSGLPVTVSVFSGPATLSGNVLTPTGVGSVELVANQAGNANYLTANQVTTSFEITPASQGIAPFFIPNLTYGVAPFSVTPPAGGGSGNAVILSVLSGPATITNNWITITGAGNVTVAADQAGNSDYAAATEVTTDFSVAQAAQSIEAFPVIPPQKITEKSRTFLLPTLAGGASGQPVLITVLSGPATIVDNIVTLTGKGVVTLAANQAGSANYSAAPEQTISFPVNLKTQRITIAGIDAEIPYTPKRLTVAKATSGLPVTLTVISGPARISGEKLVLQGTGTVTLAVNQPGNGRFAPAPQIILSFTVTRASQSIDAFGVIKPLKFTAKPIAIAIPKASSGLPVTLSVLSGPATISGHKLILTGTGTVVLAANQPGNGNYTAASQVTTTFLVNPSG